MAHEKIANITANFYNWNEYRKENPEEKYEKVDDKQVDDNKNDDKQLDEKKKDAKQIDDDSLTLAWTERKLKVKNESATASNKSLDYINRIFINDIFEHRLALRPESNPKKRHGSPITINLNKKSKKKSSEKKIESENDEKDEQAFDQNFEDLSDERVYILFAMAISLVHELAHLLLRWSGQENSPQLLKFAGASEPEAGNYIEFLIFDGNNIFITINKEKDEKWTKEMHITGMIFFFIKFSRG